MTTLIFGSFPTPDMGEPEWLGYGYLYPSADLEIVGTSATLLHARDPATGCEEYVWGSFDTSSTSALLASHITGVTLQKGTGELIWDWRGLSGTVGDLLLAPDAESLNASVLAGPDLIFGNALGDRLRGYGGDDTVHGGDGNDSLQGGDGNDWLQGDAGNDTLSGNAGDDPLNGGAGADWMVGGPGHDTYIVDDPGDVVVENGGEGSDNIQAWTSVALPANVESLFLLAPGLLGIGNELGNYMQGSDGADLLYGSLGDDVIVALGGGDLLNGEQGKDSLAGGSGADTLIGGPAHDILSGGPGDDLYVVAPEPLPGTLLSMHGDSWVLAGERYYTPDDGNFQFALQDFTGDGLIDTLNFSFTDPDYSHTWHLDFSTRALGVNLTPGYYGGAMRYPFEDAGHPGLDVWGEGRGSNMVTGDFTVTTATIDYSSGTPQLEALWIDFEHHSEGGTAAVLGTLLFGLPPRWDADQVIESPGEGEDRVEASGPFVLPANVEHLVLTGTDASYGTGNSLNNSIAGNALDNLLAGDVGDDTLFGNEGADSLLGDAGDDLLQGNAGSDTLRGALGNDDERGGQDNDFIYGGQGADTQTGALGDDELHGGLENDVLSAGQGNDTLYGGQNDDLLQGRAGNDSLIGGLGSDRFWFNSYGDATADTIVDFDPAFDLLQFDPSVFTGQLGYDTPSGALYYDHDGFGTGEDAQLVATLVGAPALELNDFLIG